MMSDDRSEGYVCVHTKGSSSGLCLCEGRKTVAGNTVTSLFSGKRMNALLSKKGRE